MKKYFLLLVVFFLTFNCKSQNLSNISKIKYSSTVRTGRCESVIMSKDSIIVSIIERRSNEVIYCTKKKNKKCNWNKLTNTLKNLKIEEISNLKSPTMNRTFDGAAHSEIEIITKDNKNYQHLFDDKNPNEKLIQTLNFLVKYLPKK